MTNKQLIKMLKRFPASALTNVQTCGATEDQDGQWKISLKLSENFLDKTEEKEYNDNVKDKQETVKEQKRFLKWLKRVNKKAEKLNEKIEKIF